MEYAAASPDRGRCLVTGATGFIGGAVSRRLLTEGYQVRCLARASSDRSRLAGAEVEFATGDLDDPDSLAAAADGCRTVVHCGAMVSDWAAVQEIRDVNVRGTANVITAAAGARVERFIHISTTDVYGHPGIAAVDEEYPQGAFANWYSQTKRESEEIARAVAARTVTPLVILRPATVYGPGSKDVIGQMARAITRGQMLMVDRGRAVAGLIYVENLVDAIMLALEHPAAPGEAFNVSDELQISWRTLLEDLSAGLGASTPRLSLPYGAAHGLAVMMEHGYRQLHRSGITTAPLLSRQAVQVLGRSQDFSSKKLRRTLGWAPRVSYREGLAETLAWIKHEYLA